MEKVEKIQVQVTDPSINNREGTSTITVEMDFDWQIQKLLIPSCFEDPFRIHGFPFPKKIQNDLNAISNYHSLTIDDNRRMIVMQQYILPYQKKVLQINTNTKAIGAFFDGFYGTVIQEQKEKYLQYFSELVILLHEEDRYPVFPC